MSNAHGGVFDIFRLLRLTLSISAILLSPFEFPSSSQRTRNRTGSKEGEVSDPPFFEAGTSRRSGPCSTLFPTAVKSQGVAHFSHYHCIDPCGKALARTARKENISPATVPGAPIRANPSRPREGNPELRAHLLRMPRLAHRAGRSLASAAGRSPRPSCAGWSPGPASGVEGTSGWSSRCVSAAAARW